MSKITVICYFIIFLIPRANVVGKKHALGIKKNDLFLYSIAGPVIITINLSQGTSFEKKKTI